MMSHMTSQGPLVHGISHRENHTKVVTMVIRGEVCLNPRAFQFAAILQVLQNLSPCLLVVLSLSWLHKPAILLKNAFESPIEKGAPDQYPRRTWRNRELRTRIGLWLFRSCQSVKYTSLYLGYSPHLCHMAVRMSEIGVQVP